MVHVIQTRTLQGQAFDDINKKKNIIVKTFQLFFLYNDYATFSKVLSKDKILDI